MKKRFVSGLLSLALLTSLVPTSLAAERSPASLTAETLSEIQVAEQTFPDAAFRNWIKNPENIGGAGTDGVLTAQEIAGITSMDLSEASIASLEGIEVFTSLKNLNCSDNQLTTLDLTGVTSLEWLYCRRNPLQTISIAGLSKLKYADISQNQLTSLSLDGLTSLEFLHAGDNKLTEIDLSPCTGLTPIAGSFCLWNNRLSSITLPNIPDMTVSPYQYQEQNPETGTENTKWYLNSSFTQEITGDITAQGQTLYGKKIPNSFKVQFLANDGVGSKAPVTGTYGETAKLTADGFTRFGYTFTGWNTAPKGTGTSYAGDASISGLGSKRDGQTLYLYAQWAPITYQVTFHKNNDAATGSMDQQTLTFDQPSTLSENGFSLADKEFAGWSASPEGPVLYSDTASVGTLLQEGSHQVDLYAQWRTPAAEQQKQYLSHLSQAFSTYQSSQYTTEDWETLAEKYQQGVTSITDAQEEPAMQQALSTATAAMEQVTKLEARAREVINGWKAAHSSILAQITSPSLEESTLSSAASASAAAADLQPENLAAYASLSQEQSEQQAAAAALLSLETEKEQLQSFLEAANWVESLQGLTKRSMEQVTSSLTETYEKKISEYTSLPSQQKAHILSQVETDLSARAALAAQKRSGAETLRQTLLSFSKEDYSQKGQEALQDAAAKYIASVEAASSSQQIEAAVAQGKTALDAVPTQEEEDAKLPEQPEVPDTGSGGGSGTVPGGDGSGEEEETPETPETPVFSDVAPNSWYAPAVAYVTEKKLFLGTSDTTFSPNHSMTRAMIATVLYRAAGEPEITVPQDFPFADVNPDSWYGKAVYWAYTQGIVKGTSADSFSPSASVTREQMASLLYRFAGEPETNGELSSFTDKDSISSYAQDALSWAVETGVMQGTGNEMLSPKNKSTRAQVAKMLMQHLEA